MTRAGVAAARANTFLLFGLAALLGAACGGPAQVPPNQAPGEHPSGRPFRYSCGEGPEFISDKLKEAQYIEKENSERGEALRTLLSSPEGDVLARKRWREVASTDAQLLLVAPNPQGEHPYSSALFEARTWDAAGWGDCTPTVVAGDRSTAIWKLAEEPEAESTRLAVSLEERACSSGRKLTEENTQVDVHYETDEIEILITGDPLKSRGGVFTCELRVNELQIDLEQPVGDRALLDVAVYPPVARDR